VECVPTAEIDCDQDGFSDFEISFIEIEEGSGELKGDIGIVAKNETYYFLSDMVYNYTYGKKDTIIYASDPVIHQVTSHWVWETTPGYDVASTDFTSLKPRPLYENNLISSEDHTWYASNNTSWDLSHVGPIINHNYIEELSNYMNSTGDTNFVNLLHWDKSAWDFPKDEYRYIGIMSAVEKRYKTGWIRVVSKGSYLKIDKVAFQD